MNTFKKYLHFKPENCGHLSTRRNHTSNVYCIHNAGSLLANNGVSLICFPPGVHFSIHLDSVLQPFLSAAMDTFFEGTVSSIEDGDEVGALGYNMNCTSAEHKWNKGADFYK